MSARRVLAGSALALLMPASLLISTEIGSANAEGTTSAPAASSARAAAAGQRTTIDVLPQIVAQGRRTASADAAKAAVSARFTPVRTGRPVALQELRGSSWKTVSKARLDRKGSVVFAAKVSRNGLPVSYRVQAAKFKGLGKAETKSASTERWLAPTWTDEFSGNSLAPHWNHRGQSYERESLRLCSKGDPSAVKVASGAARISVLKDKSRKTLCKARERGKVVGKYAYRLNGHIGTENAFSFKYGVAAARIKTHKLRGQHSSFWLQPVGGNTPSSDGHEIDVIEYFGDRHPQGGLTSFIHRYKGKRLIKTGSWIKDSRSFLKNGRDNWSKNYHVFSVEWTPRTLIFRIDGKETWRVSGGISNAPQYPILSLLASDYELSEMKDKQLPQHMYVDWLRVWETQPGA